MRNGTRGTRPSEGCCSLPDLDAGELRRQGWRKSCKASSSRCRKFAERGREPDCGNTASASSSARKREIEKAAFLSMVIEEAGGSKRAGWAKTARAPMEQQAPECALALRGGVCAPFPQGNRIYGISFPECVK